MLERIFQQIARYEKRYDRLPKAILLSVEQRKAIDFGKHDKFIQEYMMHGVPILVTEEVVDLRWDK